MTHTTTRAGANPNDAQDGSRVHERGATIPQASIEFEVPEVATAADELKAKGYRLIHDAQTEPWGQITARLLSPEGLLLAVCCTPSFHDDTDA